MGEIVVSIDIGTSKVCTLIGQISKANQIEILGESICPCNGVRKGIIVDIESTSNSIRNSVEQAQAMANIKLQSAYVNIMGTHVSIINSKAGIGVSNENREITAKDVERVVNAAKDVHIPEDRQIIDVIPRQYIVDGYDEIIDPIGMVGVRLEVDADVIAGKITSVQNIVKSMERAGVRVDGFVVDSFATGEMVLTPEEKDMGIILIDMGGSVTDISVFKNKKLLHNSSLPVGGDHITSDISIGLKIPYAEAERIKRQYELALSSLIKNDQEIIVSELNEARKKTVMVSEVVEIIEARVQEIFALCKGLLEKSKIGSESFSAGVVLTGGGISYIDGNTQLAYEEFDVPVRVASYKNAGVSKAEYITSAGVIKYVSNYYKKSSVVNEAKAKAKKQKNTGKWSQLLKKIFDNFF